MSNDWRLSPKLEKLFRDALNHALHRRVEELRTLISGMADEEVAMTAQLCSFVTAYTIIDVVNRRWPTDEGVQLVAEKTEKSAGNNAWPGITAQNVHLFLSRCALGFEDFTDVLGSAFPDPDDLFMAPFFFTGQVLATFGPADATIAHFLDVIEDALERGWQTDLNLLPALMLRARMPQPGQAPAGGAASGN